MKDLVGLIEDETNQNSILGTIVYLENVVDYKLSDLLLMDNSG